MTSLPAAHRPKQARPRHRSRHLRRLSCLRDQLQGMEHQRPFGAADRSSTPTARIRAASGSTACFTYEAGGDGRRRPHRAFPEELPALREAGLRDGVPDRRLLQARRGRHRAGRRRQVHRLQALLLGLPLWRARIRRRRRRDEEMHAVHRQASTTSNLAPEDRRARLRLDLPGARRAISATSAIRNRLSRC